jgi:tetratricopeptide (TPR) repeat protein
VAEGCPVSGGARGVLVSLLLSAAAGWPDCLSYQAPLISGVRYHVVRVDLHEPSVKVTPLLTLRYPGGAEPANAFITRWSPAAAITGTYFCTVSRLPVGDLVIDGQLRHFGGRGRALALTPANEPLFTSVPFGRHVDWRGFESVLAAGPTLVRGGAIRLDPAGEGFTDLQVTQRARRCAVGLTAAGKLLLVATGQAVQLCELAHAMRQLGCVEALNLDGGSSACLYYRGRWLLRPQRWLVNLLAVFVNVPREHRVAAAHPGAVFLQARAQAAAQLYQRALALSPTATRANLLARACELDTEQAAYCVALAETLAALGEVGGAAGAYTQASRRYRAKGRWEEAYQQAQRAVDLAPQQAQAVEELGRAARLTGRPNLARELTRRARALYLLQAVAAAHPAALTAVVQAMQARVGHPAPPAPVEMVITGQTLSAAGVGLYARLPAGWDWLPPVSASCVTAQRRYMPWLVHIALAAVPPQATLEVAWQEYTRGSMLVTEPPRPALVGTVPGLAWRARAIAGEEIASYQVIMAKHQALLLIITWAAPESLWEQARAEMQAVVNNLTFAPPER